MFTEDTIILKPSSVEELQSMVRQGWRVLPRGGGTKPALSSPPLGVRVLEMAGITGILEYDPSEYTITAMAGTPLSEVIPLLARNGQYLPFDPPLVRRGATLGGNLAAGLSGSGRYHYGGVRDFIMGVRFVNGEGELIRGGGKVVKNTAGFDLPKLMVGSLGSLGVLTELTYKVFPRPEVYSTLGADHTSLDSVLQAMQRAATSRLDVAALDIEPVQSGFRLWVRLGGLPAALPARLERMRNLLGECSVLRGADEDKLWQDVTEMAWVPEGWCLLKIPLTPGRIPAFEAGLAGKPGLRRYISGGQLVWLASPESPRSLGDTLSDLGLSALVLSGEHGMPRLGDLHGEALFKRVKAVLDPSGRFVEA